MKFEEILRQMTEEFIDHWNRWDFDLMRSFLHEDVVVHSPLVNLVFPDAEAQVVKGREQVLDYWRRLQPEAGRMQFNLESLEKVDRKVYAVSGIEGDSRKLFSEFHYNEYGKVIELVFDYR